MYFSITFYIKDYNENKDRYKQSFTTHSFSRVRLFVTPWTAARQASLSISNSHS